MKMLKEISNKNIRATALKEFWGDQHEDSIFLWEGAKHNLTLDEMKNLQVATMRDLFSTEAKINIAYERCKELYHKFLPAMTIELNEIHSLDLSASFWGTVFGYWLFRHICIVYEKYSYLSKINTDKTSIKLLDKDSFFIPYDHYEYVYCFCTDFGVQQLVSQYYYLFANKEFPTIKKSIAIGADNKTIEKKNLNIRKFFSTIKRTIFESFIRVISLLIKPRVVLLSVFYSKDVKKQLVLKSKGQIQSIRLPKGDISQKQISELKRQKILNINVDNEFEHFLVQTFYYCIPRIFIEQFRDYYDAFLADIQKRDFTHIVSEGWIGDNKVSTYCAIAKNNGRKLIGQEHAAMTPFLNRTLDWIESENADFYLTTGWTDGRSNIVPGGFSCRNIKKYQFKPWKKSILFISHVRFPYLIEFGGNNESNSNYIRSLKIVRDFMDLLPDNLRKHFSLRPRRGANFWNSEHAWEIEKRNVVVDIGNYSRSVMCAKLVVIDHLSTGVAEILSNNIPCLIIHDSTIVPLSENFRIFIDDLAECGVVHNSAQSAVEHLTKIYDDVMKWWNSSTVQNAIDNLVSNFLAPYTKTVDYLLSCLKGMSEPQ